MTAECVQQAAAHYSSAVELDGGNANLRAEAAAVDTVRAHIEQGALRNLRDTLRLSRVPLDLQWQRPCSC